MKEIRVEVYMEVYPEVVQMVIDLCMLGETEFAFWSRQLELPNFAERDALRRGDKVAERQAIVWRRSVMAGVAQAEETQWKAAKK